MALPIRVVSLFAGLVLLGSLAWSHDVGAIVAAVATVGWGAAWVVLAHVPIVWTDMLAWRHLVDGGRRPSRVTLFRFRWIGEAINTLLPAAQVGGDVVRARLLTLAGVPVAEAGATVVVDFTLGLATQVVFTLVGVAALLGFVAPGDVAAPLVSAAIGTIAVAVLVCGIQRAGIVAVVVRFLNARARGAVWRAAAGGAAALEGRVRELYGRRRDLAIAAAWRLASWLGHAVEVWLVFVFLGVDAGWKEALVVESLTCAIRSAAFVIPGALGAQEGGILTIAGLLGLPPDAAWAVAMVKRIRELAFGGPGLVLWMMAEQGASGRVTVGRGDRA